MIFNILIVFLIVYFLIFIHEFGHFLAAKRNGVKVEEFSIGFPPRLISFKKGGTKFSFALLPLGGYVKLHGDTADESASKIVKSKSFAFKTPWQKIKILLAGVFMNFLVYLVLMTAAFSFGVPKLIQSYDQLISEVNQGSIQVEPGLKISSIEKDSKADREIDLNSEIDYVDGKYFINSNLEFDNISNLNEYGVSLSNFVELPVLKVLKYNQFLSKNDLILSVNQNKFTSYDDFISLVNLSKGPIFLEVYNSASQDVSSFQLNTTSSEFMVLNVFNDSSAMDAGVKTGFKLRAINDISIARIDNFSDFVKNLDTENVVYSFLDGNDKVLNLKITPDANGITGMVLNPIYNSVDLNNSFVLDSMIYTVASIDDVKLPFLTAFLTSLKNGFSMSWTIMKSFVDTIFSFFTSFEVSKDVGGPVAVFKMSYDYVSIGGAQLMQFVALISLTLAAINILPVPVLDGGRIMIVLFEAILGKPVSRKFVNLLTLASFGVLMFFILIVTIFDIIRL
ncbi:hypothetical protein CL656_04270 [bacterium]|nr:hypothetical protein [bacterium]|tara:strand:- start:2919 stop:4442 length:1524 start_codon:yes stop_codon:yes gene_type:complete